MKLYLWLAVCILSHAQYVNAQDTTALKIPDKFLDQVQVKANRLQKRTDQRLEKSLNLYLKQEKLMRDKLAIVDPGKAQHVFDAAINKLQQYKAGLKGKAAAMIPLSNAMIGNNYVDSLAGSLAFIKDAKGMIGANDKKLTSALANVDALKGKLQQSAEIEKFISEHKEQLKIQLAQYSNMLPNLKAINQEYYYYHAQMNEYMGMFRDPKKAEQKALILLQKLPAFTAFMKRNSLIAGLFNLGADFNVSRSLDGMQTRALIAPYVQTALGSSPNASQVVNQRMQQAMSTMEELKKKFPGGGGTAADMPDFQPKPLKSKTFFQRLEPGGNVQFQKSNQYFPSTAEMAGQLAYKLSTKSNVGVGLSYTLGMGSGWDHIVFSHKAYGLRSFLSYKVKGNWYANGGMEANKIIAKAVVADYTKTWNGWQGSSLLGLSKVFQVNAKVKSTVMLLYDFWPSQNLPQNRFKIRIGYSR
jgi:hypothetical protein